MISESWSHAVYPLLPLSCCGQIPLLTYIIAFCRQIQMYPITVCACWFFSRITIVFEQVVQNQCKEGLHQRKTTPIWEACTESLEMFVSKWRWCQLQVQCCMRDQHLCDFWKSNFCLLSVAYSILWGSEGCWFWKSYCLPCVYISEVDIFWHFLPMLKFLLQQIRVWSLSQEEMYDCEIWILV